DRVDDRVGLPISRVTQGTPAERAGFQEGDLIVSIDGLVPRTRSRYTGIISTYPAGDQLTVDVVRDDKKVSIRAVIGPDKPYLGIRTKNSDDGPRVSLLRPKSPAAAGGLQVGDLIQRVGDEDIASTRELSRYLKTRRAGDEIVLSVLRDGKKVDVTVRLGASRPKR
ncbi:MAG: PDZ domain-containing protein, partial [Planctomycetota bacterium]